MSISNNCIIGENEVNKLLLGHKRQAEVVAIEIQALAKKYGIERLGFLTLTFPDKIRDVRTAKKRFHSLATNVLSKRYERCLVVMERGEKTRLVHFHLVVVLQEDIRTGVDFEAIENKDYKTAGRYLRSEWRFWRKTAPAYKFGRTELLPVKSTAQGIARYVGKYISKHIKHREEADKGARVVTFIGYKTGQRNAYARFAWNTPGGWLWRKKLEAYCQINKVDVDKLKELFGPKWCYLLSESIMSINLADVLGTITYPTPSHARADGVTVTHEADKAAPVTREVHRTRPALKMFPANPDPIWIPKYWDERVRLKTTRSERETMARQIKEGSEAINRWWMRQRYAEAQRKGLVMQQL